MSRLLTLWPSGAPSVEPLPVGKAFTRGGHGCELRVQIREDDERWLRALHLLQEEVSPVREPPFHREVLQLGIGAKYRGLLPEALRRGLLRDEMELVRMIEDNRHNG